MRDIVIKGVYKHFKGDKYIVEDIGIYTETNEKCVIYRALYADGKVFIRPLDMFMDEVDKKKYPNVSQKYRFELQKIESKNK